jgi:hypothetical protein
MPSTDTGPHACIYGEWCTGSMTGGTYFDSFADFGGLLDHAQYELLREEVEVWIGPSPTAPEEIKKAAELKEAEEQIEALRKRYEAEGYHKGQGKELEQISDTYFSQRMLGPIFVVPEDVSALLDCFGNPLVDEEGEENEELAPVFDITKPAHWQAMQARIERYNE